MANKTIQAAGGIVVRRTARPLIAVVQRSKDDRWVLPRGKLKRDENPVAGAKREVVEETGHRVEVHEFVGAITYRAGGRPKAVQFWRMDADDEPSHELMSDIVAVDWLPLKAAIRRLSYPLEKLFLRNVGPRVVARRKAGPSRGKAASKKAGKKRGKKKDKVRKKSGKAKRSAVKPAKQKKKKRASSRKAGTRKTRGKVQQAGRGGQSGTVTVAVRKPPVQELSLTPASVSRTSAASGRKTILQRMLRRFAG